MVRPFQEVHIGQVWSVHDHRRGGRRYAEVVSTTERINDPTAAGERVLVINTDTGRRTGMKGATMRKHWRLETEPEQ